MAHFPGCVSQSPASKLSIDWCGIMEMRPLLNVSSPDREARNHELNLINGNLTDVAADIASVIEQVESLREDLESGDARSLVCCCRRRDLRKLEDRLWARLHLLQKKENELHRQKTVVLSHSLLPGESTQEGLLPSVSPDAPASPSWLPKRQQGQEVQEHVHHHPSQYLKILLEHRRAPQPPRLLPTQEDHESSVRPVPAAAAADPLGFLSSTRALSATMGTAGASDGNELTRPTAQARLGGSLAPALTHSTVSTALHEAHAVIRRRPSRPGSAEDTGSGAE